ncbi:Rossmann-like and DUF2520 domain-containing protein [Robertkochia solimangrovi]|uniref:Rossmann-like and DUF2520 domain-containing protein n=1 Tax=Robertkochia solimangrovi TaxID=2213046 RepID=UPI00117FB15B|nr:DUF2520 domain-containing protein [Robertkochia solimangrovi]TRZ42322.1 DUF2520 domain-containing protein [Robertkochia solimangrovi]
MIRIVIIGTGNVASHLIKGIQNSDSLMLAGIFSRNPNQETIDAFGDLLFTDLAKIPAADLCLIAVKDDAISGVSEKLLGFQGVVAHTSGNTDLEILAKHGRTGVFYPLMTFSKHQRLELKKVPICIEAKNAENELLLYNTAVALSENVHRISSEQRRFIHLTAVFVNNFVNHLIYQGKVISDNNNIPFEIFSPLIEETIKKAFSSNPFNAQTGPARRNDTKTINSHLEILSDPLQREIYELLTLSIIKTYE